MTDEQLKKLQGFLTNAIPLEKSGLGALFTFVAVERDGEFVLIAGRLERNIDLWAQPKPTYENSKIKVRSYYLNELGLTIDGLVTKLIDGRLETPFGTFSFPSGIGNHSIFPFEFKETLDGKLVDGLQISGVQRTEVEKYPGLNWAVKSLGEKPTSFSALLNEWGFDPNHGAIKVDILDLPVATFEPASHFDGRSAEIAVNLPVGFEASQVDLAMRWFTGTDCLHTENVNEHDIAWLIQDKRQVGRLTRTMIASERLECIVSYRDRPQQQITLEALPIPLVARRNAIERFNDGATLDELVSALERDIEAGKQVAALDRLHTYCMALFGHLLTTAGEYRGENETLHSRMGRYFGLLRKAGKLSKMSEAIIKGATRAFDEFSSVRNNASLANDNTLLSPDEALFIFDSIQIILRFLNWVEATYP